ncbi:MAG: rod shape-determining protein MreD [Paludibacteraceae bacterium]|nr:rod shape-determining protein MreD [Paludibacteraceae bacterium]MDD6357798.1 rod shape-determining protein MreD [Bacteroidales bacterium]
MAADLIKYFIKFVLLVLIQVFVLNNIQFSGYVNPYLYVLFIVTLPFAVPRIWTMCIAFVLGLSIDIFSNTPGMHAFACVMVAFLRHYIILLFSNSEIYKSQTELSVISMGKSNFFMYAATVVFLHHATLFVIDTFSLHSPLFLLLRILYSFIFTMLLIFGIEFFKQKPKQR